MRPDITSSVTMVAPFATDFGLAHWEATKRTLPHLSGARNMQFTNSEASSPLEGNADMDSNEAEDWRTTLLSPCPLDLATKLGPPSATVLFALWEKRKQ